LTPKLLNNESGYSLVEVLAAIVILAVAILPMVGMFDAGLRAAVLGSNYDQARALANEKLEEVRALEYEEARDNFPTGSSTPNPTYTSSPIAAPPDTDLPNGSYTVFKRYVDQQFDDASSDIGLIKTIITVNWGPDENGDGVGDKSYKTTGLVADGSP
jgi:prepilin-type N-terminal cleavage/methylation domain-containing protein